MTREEAIELARKAGHPQPGMDGLFFQRLVNLAAAAEREACADIAETYEESCGGADAIRARGQS